MHALIIKDKPDHFLETSSRGCHPLSHYQQQSCLVEQDGELNFVTTDLIYPAAAVDCCFAVAAVAIELSSTKQK